MKLLLFFFICLLNVGFCDQLAAMPQQELVIDHPPKKSKIAKQKIRWKQVFRPIKVFRKPMKFWLLWALSGLALMSLIFFIADKTDEAEGDIFYFFAGVWILSAVVLALCLLVIPIIILIRIFQELAWRKRYQRCFK